MKNLQLEVRLFAYLREKFPETLGGTPLFLEIAEGSTVNDLLIQLGLDQIDIPLIVMVNGVREFDEKVLKDKDRVGIFPPIGGG